ncbi:MAG: hypothetical protein RLY86_674 [Pseudomonadota bacterium]
MAKHHRPIHPLFVTDHARQRLQQRHGLTWSAGLTQVLLAQLLAAQLPPAKGLAQAELIAVCGRRSRGWWKIELAGRPLLACIELATTPTVITFLGPTDDFRSF